MTDRTPHRRPARLRRTALVAGLTLAGTLAAAPAWGAPPETWDNPENPSLAGALLQIGGPVLVIIAIIALLTYLPSMIRSNRGDSPMTFADKSDWFGGPRKGVDQQAEQPQGTGGGSARW
jgi:hypothetical protein